MLQHAELLNLSRCIMRVVLFAVYLVFGAAGGCILLNLNGPRQKYAENIQSGVLQEHLQDVVNGSARSGD